MLSFLACPYMYCTRRYVNISLRWDCFQCLTSVFISSTTGVWLFFLPWNVLLSGIVFNIEFVSILWSLSHSCIMSVISSKHLWSVKEHRNESVYSQEHITSNVLVMRLHVTCVYGALVPLASPQGQKKMKIILSFHYNFKLPTLNTIHNCGNICTIHEQSLAYV